MWGFWVFVVAWNAFALIVGVLGLFKPDARAALARIANRQAAVAVAISLICFLLGVLGLLLGPVGAAALLLAWVFWAAGGLLPFTIAILLRARRRGGDEEPERASPPSAQ